MGGAESAGRLPGAWRVVALLCCLYGLSFFDRMVLALVIDPVRTSLNVTDTDVSLLFGMGFVVYVLAGFPAAQFVDAARRKQILIAGSCSGAARRSSPASPHRARCWWRAGWVWRSARRS